MEAKEREKGFKKLINTLKGLTWKERFEYLWEYYKWVAIAAVLVIAAAVSVVISVKENSRNILYGGVSVNVGVADGAETHLVDYWMTQLEGNPKKDRVDFDQMYINTSADTMSDLGMDNIDKLMVMVEGGEVDYLILNAYSLSYCGKSGMFSPLEKGLSAQTIAQFEGRIVTVQTDDGSYQGAIDITDLPFTKKYFSSSDKVYIAFPANTGREATNEAFLQYLMNWTE